MNPGEMGLVKGTPTSMEGFTEEAEFVNVSVLLMDSCFQPREKMDFCLRWNCGINSFYSSVESLKEALFLG